ncbi:hypothetical protein WN944_010143 [Citrus x changshan-huyou]|uniref:Uncharacterized protein n=1 Tax=Citrus x changshan-huyou TaxID=2935761 RepID=A0AAP0R0D8_9ROSI
MQHTAVAQTDPCSFITVLQWNICVTETGVTTPESEETVRVLRNFTCSDHIIHVPYDTAHKISRNPRKKIKANL